MSLLSDDEKVQHLQQHWADGGSDLVAFERLLIEVIETGAWESFHTPNGNSVTPTSFRSFITNERFQGLGATEEKIAALLGDDNTAVVKMRILLKGKSNPEGRNQHSEPKVEKGSTNNISRTTKHGTRRDYTLERLQRDAPELFESVQRNELSPNAAAIKAGFRPKTFTVRADRPESIVGTLRRQLDPETLAMVTKLLTEED
jgi:hypothetical protein